MAQTVQNPYTHPVGGTNEYAYDFALPGFPEDQNPDILAVRNGIVKIVKDEILENVCGDANDMDYDSLNNYVEIEHEYINAEGQIIKERSHYMHFQKVYVVKNQVVKQGDVIGTMGKTGRTGCKIHLHFKVKDPQDSNNAKSRPVYFAEQADLQEKFLIKDKTYYSQNFQINRTCHQLYEEGVIGGAWIFEQDHCHDGGSRGFFDTDTGWVNEPFNIRSLLAGYNSSILFQTTQNGQVYRRCIGEHQYVWELEAYNYTDPFTGAELPVNMAARPFEMRAFSNPNCNNGHVDDICVPIVSAASMNGPTDTCTPNGSIGGHIPGTPPEQYAFDIELYNGLDPDGSTRCNDQPGHFKGFDSPYVFLKWERGTSPGGTCPSDRFSGKIFHNGNWPKGSYSFHLFAGEKVRLKFNGTDNNDKEWLIDSWTGTEHNESIVLDNDCNDCTIEIQFQDTGDEAWVNAWWEIPGEHRPFEGRDPNQWHSAYWVSEYGPPFLHFNDGNALPFNKYWGAGGPGYGLDTDAWRSEHVRDYAFACGLYNFDISADDRVNIEVTHIESGEKYLTLSNPENNSSARKSGVAIPAGIHEVKVYHVENGGNANLEINWELVAPCIDYNPISSIEGVSLESFEETNSLENWTLDPNGNALSISQETVHASDGGSSAHLIHKGTWAGFRMDTTIESNWTGAQEIQFHVVNTDTIEKQVSISLEAPDWSHSILKTLPKGSSIISYKLNNGFTEWETFPTNMAQVVALWVIVHGDGNQGQIYLDNIRVVGMSSAPIDFTPIPSTDGVQIESFEDEFSLNSWNLDPNGNALEITRTMQYASDGNYSARLDHKEDWAGFELGNISPSDWSGVTSIQLHLVNPDDWDKEVSISLGTTGWNHSHRKPLPQGSSIISFDLGGAWTDWENPVNDLDQVGSLWVIIHGANVSGSVYLDNIRGTGLPPRESQSMQPIPSTTGTLVESFEDEYALNSWNLDPNGNALEITRTMQHASDGNYSAQLDHKEDWAGFELVNISPSDWSDVTAIQLHLINPDGWDKEVSISLGTNGWNHSHRKPLPPGSSIVSFDLGGAWTDWENPITDIDQVGSLWVIVHGANVPGNVYLDNIRKVGQEAQNFLYYESFETGTGNWGIDTADSSATAITQTSQGVSDGNYAAQLDCTGGNWAYWYHQLPTAIDLSNIQSATLDATTVNQASIKLIVITDPGTWHESPELPVTGDTLTFDLSGIDESARTNVITLGLGVGPQGQECNGLIVDNLQILNSNASSIPEKTLPKNTDGDSYLYLPLIR
ncbi:MAG: M23 family metallopeptidase [Caldilineaceae bacterium]